MRDPGAPNLILAGKAGDVGTGAADPPALHNGSTSPRLRHMPSEQLPAKSAAKDQDFNRFCLRHEHLPCPSSRSKRSRKDRIGTSKSVIQPPAIQNAILPQIPYAER